MVALKFSMNSHLSFPLPKFFSPSRFVPPLSNGTSRATSDRKPKTNDQILPSPILCITGEKAEGGLLHNEKTTQNEQGHWARTSPNMALHFVAQKKKKKKS